MIKQISVATAILLAAAGTAFACPADGVKGKTATEANMSKPAMQIGKASTAEKPAATESKDNADKAAKPKA